MEQCFVTMDDVAVLLENEKAKAPKERFYSRKPLYPMSLLSKPYPYRYEPPIFSQYDGRKGSFIGNVSKFIDTWVFTQQTRTCAYESSQNPYVIMHTLGILA